MNNKLFVNSMYLAFFTVKRLKAVYHHLTWSIEFVALIVLFYHYFIMNDHQVMTEIHLKIILHTVLLLI
ncbi:hypothetical protein K6959_14125 [Bacillus aquiflavi]|uniref:hypothetical protein n=1 Tax=Bacillus aquiflavi TaxID=2672567 RepID=UPI001CA87431|nr:hypothetical protein [Bacillus aquiflavi]UAC47745.1 hypothetical protein K6959_14125 [Bacillus aquiflavi]